jgi:hypothetical protein
MTAIAAIVSGFRSLADDTVRFQIDVEPRDAEAALRMLARRGTNVAIAVLTDEAAVAADQGHGEFARALHASGFFFSPDVWRAAGTDKEFLTWLKRQKCMAGGIDCAGDIVAAHVRKVSEGAGVGIKPEYCAVPLCHHHHQLQHDKGYSAVHVEGIDGFMAARAHYCADWAKQAIKTKLGVESLREVSPAMMLAWAEPRNLERYLPREYR